MALIIEEKKGVAITTTNASATTTTTPAATATATTTTTPTATTVAQDFSTTTSTDIHSEVKAEEEKEKKKQTNNSNLPVWLQASSYESDDEDSEVTEEDVSNALNEIVQYELSEIGKENTIYHSDDNYNQGFTHNGKVVNGSCTEGGMKKAILGDYITLIKEDGTEVKGVEAMADSYDSTLDLLTQERFKQVLADKELGGYGTFLDNCNFLKHTDEIREKYGIDIKVIQSVDANGNYVAGLANRTFEISLVDEKGNIIEDADGNKSTILFGDWVIPDGTAQGAEFDFISVIDKAGFDCVSKADFIDNETFAANPEFQDENGNYDPAKAYAYVIGQLENDLNNLKNGGQGQYMKKGTQSASKSEYSATKFEWWSKGGGKQYYQNSRLDSSLLGGVVTDLEKAFDLDNDGVLSAEEQAEMAKEVGSETEEHGAKKAGEAKKAAKPESFSDNSVAQQIAKDNLNEANKGFESRMDELMRENPEKSEEELMYQVAEELSKEYDIDADDLVYNYKH